MDRDNLKRLYGINFYAAEKNIEGLTDEEARAWPEGGNSINWILGHMVFARDLILQVLEQEPILTEAQGKAYGRGSERQSEEAYLSLDTLRDKLRESQSRLLKGLEQAPDDAFNKPQGESNYPPGFQETEGDKVVFFQFHEAYHVGQLGILRRIVGKEGAIA